MRRPLCVKCQMDMRAERNGVTVVETYMGDKSPYKTMRADLFKCPCCGFEVISGIADTPFWRAHHEKSFEEAMAETSGLIYWWHEKCSGTE